MSAPHHSIFTGRMLFLMSNQQHQITEGNDQRWREDSIKEWTSHSVTGDGQGDHSAITVKFPDISLTFSSILPTLHVDTDDPSVWDDRVAVASAGPCANRGCLIGLPGNF